jgi:tetratricopeptide (TPR) repeat protein
MSAAEWYARQRGRLALHEAERRRAAGETDAAVSAFERAGELDPGLRRGALEAVVALLLEHGRPADAVPRLKRLSELDPPDLMVLRRLARTQLEAGDRDAAIEAWRRVRGSDARDLEANRALAGLLSEDADDLVPVLKVVAEAAGPSDAAAWRRLAKALEHAGDKPGAVEAWRTSRTSAPSDRLARDRLADLLEGLGRKAEAAVEMQAIAEDAGKAKSWKRYARTLEELGQEEPAYQAWRRVSELDPADMRAHERMAFLLEAQGFGGRAVVHLRALAEAGEDKKAWRRLALALAEFGSPEETATAWRRVLSLAPGSLEAHAALAELPADPADRLVHLKALAEAAPENLEAWRAFARALAGQDDRTGAADAWRRVLQLDGGDLEAHAAMVALIGADNPDALVHLQVLADQTPDDPVPHERLAELLPKAGQPEAAAVHLRWLAERSGGAAKPWRRLAQALTALGDVSGELEAWGRVLAADPGEIKAHERTASLLEASGQTSEAAAHLGALAQSQPDKIKHWKRYARTLEELGRDAEAFQAWRRALQVDPKDASAHDRLAVLLLAQGLKARAIEHLRFLAESGQDHVAWRRLARELTELSSTADAIAAWRRVLQIAPEEIEAHRALAVLLAADPAEAAPHLRAVAEAAPKTLEPLRDYARALTAAGDADKAIATWRRVLEREEADAEAHGALVELIGARKPAAQAHLQFLAEHGPDLAEARRGLALLQEKLGEEPETLRTWSSLLEVAPEDPQAHERLANLLAKEGDGSGALEHLRWLAEHGANRERALRRLGLTLGEQPDADPEDELKSWLGLLSLTPGDVLARGRAASLLMSLGRPAEATAHFKALTELEPEKPKTWRLYAEAAEAAKDLETAVEVWRRALATDSKDPWANDELARLLQELGRPAEAALYLKALALREAKDPRRWRRLAACLADAGDAEGEAGALRRVLTADPSDGQAHDRLIQILEAKGAKAEAAVHARALARREPERPRPWRRLAQLLDEAGDAKGAALAWAQVIKLQPNDLATHERLAQLNLDLGRPAKAAVHLEVLAGAEAGKSRVWRRLAQVLQDAGDAKAEIRAWGHLLAIEPDDLQAHERLAHLLADAGKEPEAMAHLEAVVRLQPENARAWRRYARALTKADPALGATGVWRRTLSLAGQVELDAQLERGEQSLERVQAMKQELQVAAAELKRERGLADHAKSRVEREERAHRATQGLLKDEIAERKRLTHELQDNVQRHRQAKAEEASHLMAGRLLGLLEPPAGSETAGAGQSDVAAAYVEGALRAAAGSGALIAAREAEARLSGVELTPPGDLAARLRGKSKIVVLADPDPRNRQSIRDSLADRSGLTVLDLAQLVIRRAGGISDFGKRVDPVGDDVWPARPLMVMSSDDRLRAEVVGAIGKATGVNFAPLFPAELATKVQARELDLDDWLAAAWSANNRPKGFGFQFDPESLAIFAREIRSGRAPIMAKVFRRATALQLAWSDKALFAADDHFQRAGEVADFDAGDAQIEIKTYKRLVGRDVLLESGLEQLGKFKPETVKAYRELFDKPALGRFCRDLNLSVSATGFAEVDERSLGFMPTEELLHAGALIQEAVGSLTAIRESEPPPQGLVQYGLGRSLEALGRHAEALEAFGEAVVRAPTYFAARAAAARYLELAGRSAEAEQLLRQGIGAGAPQPDVQEGLLEFYQRNASPRGVAAVSRLMRKRGLSRPAVSAPALIELGRYREAAPLLKALAPRIAGQDTFLNDLVDLPALSGRLEELKHEAEGGDAAAQLRLAEALRRLGRLGDSLPWYRRALADPDVLRAEMGVGAEFRPQFLMVGPPRTGTTLLRRLFDLHRDIAAPSGELFFFSNRTGERTGSNRQRAPLSWYLGAFQAAAERKPDARLIGEKTPHYFSTSDEQMAFTSLLMPGVKIIATLRDPVVRAWSEIKVRRRVTEAEIVAAMSKGGRPNWLAEILDAGRYMAHLKRWLKHVEPEQLLLVDCDALETDVAQEAGRIFRWLGVRDLPRKQVESLQQGWDNRTETVPPSAQVEAMLRKSYEGEAWKAAEVGKALGLADTPEPASGRTTGRR